MQEWDRFLEHLEQKLGKPVVSKWLRTLTISSFDACNLHLEAKDPLHLHWFEEHVRPLSSAILRNRNARPIRVHITVAGCTTEKQPKKQKETPSFFLPDQLFTHANFDTFIATETPWLPSFLEDILNKRQLFNPILFWGEHGSGKSHLLMALAQTYQKLGLRAHYIRADTYTQQVVNAIRMFQLRDLRKTYRENDVLLIDDAHLFARKDATQEEFFHTFNTLHLEGKQIILSSAVAPSTMEDIEPRLISRFEWGLAHTLYPLSKERWDEALRKRCEWLHFPLSKDARSFLISAFSALSALFQALDALILRIHLEGTPLFKRNPELLEEKDVKKTLEDLLQKEHAKILTQEQILVAVASTFGIRQEDLIGKSQSRECAQPRHIAMYLLRSELRFSFPKIARIFSRDHSTVMTSVRQIETSVQKKDPEIRATLAEIKSITKRG